MFPGEYMGDRSMGTEKLALSIAETAGRLGISKSLCYEMARTGQLPVLKCGQKRLVVPVRALELWLITQTKGPAGV